MRNDLVLVVSLPYCNLNCIYCRKPEQKVIAENTLKKGELLEIIKAAEQAGVRKIRWTGGEATVNKGFLEMVKRTKELGIKEQFLSTNGTILFSIAEKARKAGINRVNISLDSLDRKKFMQITGFDLLPNVLKSINVAAKVFDLVKINTVLTKSNLKDCLKIISFLEMLVKVNSISTKRVCVKFLELIPGGYEGDKEFVEEQFLPASQITRKIKEKFGGIEKAQVPGTNPMTHYFKIKSNGIVFGLTLRQTINLQCCGEKCKELRLSPTGVMSNCITYRDFGRKLKGKSFQHKVELIEEIIKEKESWGKEFFSKRKCLLTDFSFWKFGLPSTN